MKVQARSTIKVLYFNELKITFEKDKIYNAEKFNDLGYIVINEFKENNLYSNEAFSYNFKIIED